MSRSHGTDRNRQGGKRSLPLDGRVFFIVGSPRSGTTLLRTMLAAHPHICIPHETEFFMRVPPVSGPALRQSVASYIHSGPFANQELHGGALLDALDRGTARTRSEVFLAMMARHARRAHKPLVGEKSPHHCRHVEAIARELPRAVFIHIQRDPRDVVASRLGVHWSGRSAASNARSWAAIAREHRRLIEVMPSERYTSVQFESLVNEPESELRRLCTFLREEFDPTMLRFHEKTPAASTPTLAGVTLGPLQAGAVGRYRGRLTDRQLAAVQRFTGIEMARVGYIPEPVAYRYSWLVANGAEILGQRLASLGQSLRKRLGMTATDPSSLAWRAHAPAPMPTI